MSLLDYVYHGRLPRHQVAFAYAVTPALANEAVLRHDCDPVAAQLLCRALNAGALCMHRIHRNDRLNLHWIYRGTLRNVLVDLRGDGRIRGLINPPHLQEETQTLSALYGEESGQLKCVHSRGRHTVSSGTVPCDLQNVTADLEAYFAMSEQVETALNVMVGFDPNPARPVRLCQGLLLQAMPETDLRRFDAVRQRLHADELRARLATASAADTQFEELLNALFLPWGGPGEIELEAGPRPRWFCTCNEDKFKFSLRMLPAADRADILEKGEPVTVRCDFCNRSFAFSPAECRTLWEA